MYNELKVERDFNEKFKSFNKNVVYLMAFEIGDNIYLKVGKSTRTAELRLRNILLHWIVRIGYSPRAKVLRSIPFRSEELLDVETMLLREIKKNFSPSSFVRNNKISGHSETFDYDELILDIFDSIVS